MTAAAATDRIRLRPREGDPRRNAHLDGGWWPASLDLAREITPLLHEVARLGFVTSRVSYALGAWSPAPGRRLDLDGRLVKFGAFRQQDPHVLSLVDVSGRRRLDLLVVDPGSEPEAARRALALAATDADPGTATEVLARAAAS